MSVANDGICSNLSKLARAEGRATAIAVAEHWASTLAAMIAVASPPQRSLLAPIHAWLADWLTRETAAREQEGVPI